MPGTSSSFAPRWFALRMHANHEWKVADSLRMKGIETFLPVYRIRKRWSDRKRNVEQLLFNGCVFARFTVERWLPILTNPGVIDIAGSGRTPVPVASGRYIAWRKMR